MQRNQFGALIAGLVLALLLPAFVAAPVVGSAGDGVSTRAQVPITLYGAVSPTNGWGFTAAGIDQPGPTITVNQGDEITFSLFAADDTAHILVIDFDRNGNKGADEPASPSFESSTTAVTWSWTADRAGTFQYYCQIHGASLQSGTLIVNATGGTAPPADNTLLIVGGIVAVVIIAAVAAAIMLRKPKPPAQPPAQP